MRIPLILAATSLALSACSPSEKAQTGDGLRSDIPLRTVAYFIKNDSDRAEMDAVCTAWKGSQRPITSWPAVVTENCNNADTARYQLIQKREREKFKKQMGI
ncbi:hypothetical protein VVT58_22660 (plasmid) [Sphingobium sp. SJ10-10]|uniref:Lipoprotein n=1 Tax=Sphingomonas sp. NS2 TaxID=908605 RepID=A0A0D4ZZN2_9SPHN|nr:MULTISPECIES: hypothetical protein [unclassified Sphingobium]AJW29408.1 hypothetical protein plasmid201_220 [Sphingomonas sp. NS2]AMK26608.1 hypothetical protein K426_28565 [Sphingobium sp. TKS]MEC6699627.1 hypothetical protein [Sphingobium sp. SJ10-10]